MASNPQAVCISCAGVESAQRVGAFFDLQSPEGEALRVWLCNDCAIPLGPPQGPVVAKKGMPTKL